MSATGGHLPIGVLLQDWLGEADGATREALDVHLMECDACGELLDELQALGEGVRDAVRAGVVGFVAAPGFVQRLSAGGLQVREYRLPHNGSVDCRVAPQDDVLVSRLEAPLTDVRRLDMAFELSIEPGMLHRAEDIPFDPAAGEVLILSNLAEVRARPAHTVRVLLLSQEDGGSREVGRYEFRHTPWPG